MKALLVILALTALVASPAFAFTASKDNTPIELNPGPPSVPSTLRSDFEYNTCGTMDCVPTTGGSHDGWGEWFIVTLQNTTGQDLWVKEFGFPCCGPATGDCGWIVWTNTGGDHAPYSGDGCTAEYMGVFTPVDPNPETFPPTTYTYIDVTAERICIPAGNYWTFGYDVTGNGGQVSYNGVQTYAWYSGAWDPDPGWGRTAVLQVKADYGCNGVPANKTLWGAIKSLFR
jgi:hypothetical protein